MSEISTFKVSLAEELIRIHRDLLAIADDLEVNRDDRVLFLQYSMRGDAHQFYSTLNDHNKLWGYIKKE